MELHPDGSPRIMARRRGRRVRRPAIQPMTKREGGARDATPTGSPLRRRSTAPTCQRRHTQGPLEDNCNANANTRKGCSAFPRASPMACMRQITHVYRIHARTQH